MKDINLQNSLKGLFYSLGGNADNVRKTDDVNTIIDKISDLNLGKAIEGGGGGSGVLVVNATIDFEHAESETEYPLILDKTTDEIFAAEYTVLSVDTGAGVFILGETQRGGEPLSRNIGWAWGSKLDDGSTFIAGGEEGYDGELDPKLYPIPASGGGDEPLVVTLTFDGNVATANKTASEIMAAYPTQRVVFSGAPSGVDTLYMECTGVASLAGYYSFHTPFADLEAESSSGYPSGEVTLG